MATLVPPTSLPSLSIPASTSTVKVSVINTTTRIKLPAELMVSPSYPGFSQLDAPAFSFLIEHPSSGRRILFDLGVRKDQSNFAPRIKDMIQRPGWEITVEDNVADILKQADVELDSVESIIWSHWHFDHTGDPSTFPSSTSLIVGPGFKENFLPAYPTNPDSPLLDSDFANRSVQELSFPSSSLKMGRFQALDFFGDGSFYILSAPGHAIGHLIGLARTTTASSADEDRDKDTFILMGADTCHHAGEFRPTPYLPLPRQIVPNPLHAHSPSHGHGYHHAPPPCPGALFEAANRRGAQDPSGTSNKATTPFLGITIPADDPSKGVAHDPTAALDSVDGLTEFDAHPHIFTAIAHDASLVDVVRFFPETANDWFEEGWRELALWRFLGDLRGGVDGGER